MVDKNEIKSFLNKELERLYTIYNENNILGIFVYNNSNIYSIEQIKTVVYYLPTFEELIINNNINDNIYSTQITIVDIRKLYEHLLNNSNIIINSLFSPYYILNKKYENLFKEYFLNHKNYMFVYNYNDNSFQFNENYLQKLKDGLVKLQNLSFLDNNKMNELFINNLTKTEMKVLKYLFEELNNDETYISISKATKEISISRPIFNSLFNKIKDYNIGTIENKGVKGIYIKLNDLSIIDFVNNL